MTNFRRTEGTEGRHVAPGFSVSKFHFRNGPSVAKS